MKGSWKLLTRRIALLLTACLICAGLSARADTGCWYYLKNGTHDFEQVDVKLPTCETDGYYLLECRQCGYNEKHITGKASGHSWEMIKSVGSTCDQEGYEEYKCRDCDETSTNTFPKLQHVWVDGEVLESATCTRQGCVRTYCSLCHINSNRNTAKAPHKYGNWEISIPATDHSQGTRARSCSACGDTVSESFYPDGTLYRGMDKSDSVADCQKMLIELGFLKDTADGVFGKKTEQAVKDFQAASGFETTGIAYPQTLHAISEHYDIAANPTETPPPTSSPAPTATPSMEKSSEFTRCTRYWDEAGVNRIGYCPYHAGIIDKYAARLASVETDEARLQVLDECQEAWQLELDRLYNAWFEKAPADNKPGIAQAKSMFALYMHNQETLWATNYPGQPVIVAQHIINALSQQCVDLCALAADEATLEDFSFAHSGMSMDTIYVYSVTRTERGYQADYELYCGRIKFSFPMDEADVASLAAIIKGLASWDGFHETNQYVLDGEGFSMQIVYADGSAVSASGNNSFPQGYADAESAINDYFLRLMEKHNVSIDEEDVL